LPFRKTTRVFALEEEKSVSLKQTLQNPPFKNASELSLFVGPEGGFPESEKELAKQHGIAIASLGRRILRAETPVWPPSAQSFTKQEKWGKRQIFISCFIILGFVLKF